MLETLFLIAIGLFIGWNVPQPEYAKRIQAYVVNWVKNLGNRNKK